MKSLKDKIQRQVHNKIYNQVYSNTILAKGYNNISDLASSKLISKVLRMILTALRKLL